MNTSFQRILIISLSNIGDIILTLPVIDILRRDFPSAKITVVVGPKGEGLLAANPDIDLQVFDKHQPWQKTFAWLLRIRRERFDLIVDLRNTALPLFIPAKKKTSVFLRRIPGEHMRQQHLRRLNSVHRSGESLPGRSALVVPPEDQDHVRRLLAKEVGEGNRFVVIAPGAADHGKRWSPQEFAWVADDLIKNYPFKVVFIGDESDRPIVSQTISRMSYPAIDLSGRTTLTQLSALLEKAGLLITNDSAPMHLASYLQIPVLAIFGPTDPKRYGPWSRQSCVVAKKDLCPACRALGKKLTHECLQKVKAEEVFHAFCFSGEQVIFKTPANFLEGT
jgi:ADP-heptose:LPS heptosyltransferase